MVIMTMQITELLFGINTNEVPQKRYWCIQGTQT